VGNKPQCLGLLRNNKINAISDAAKAVSPSPLIFRSDKARKTISKPCKFNKPHTMFPLPSMRKTYSRMLDSVLGAATRLGVDDTEVLAYF
jgi:hypothetical protein